MAVDKHLSDKKFKGWMDSLLDMSSRNILLNYKPRKINSYQIEDDDLQGDIEDWFNQLVDGDGYVFETNAKAFEEDSDLEEIIKQRSKKLERVRQTINSVDEEKGFNIGFVAFGFLHWIDVKNKENKSPILMVPIDITGSNNYRYKEVTFKSSEDIIINPILIKMFKDELDIEIDPDLNLEDIEEVFDYFESEIVDQPKWFIEKKAVIDTFDFQNFVILKDLEINQDKMIENPFIQFLVDRKSDVLSNVYDDYNQAIDLMEINPKDNIQILDADSSQLEAIIKARRGDSFVIQGPPGTGKSQTITNIIAEGLAGGKKILFVSEKRAALDVVYNKLKNKGLDKFVFTLHNVKQSKLNIVAQLHESLELGKKELNFKDEALSLYTLLNDEMNYLNKIDKQVHQVIPSLNENMYYLYGKLASLNTVPYMKFIVPTAVANESVDQLETIFNQVDELAQAYEGNTYHFKENAWQHYHGEYTINKEYELQELFKDYKEHLDKLNHQSKELQEQLPNQIPIKDTYDVLGKMHKLNIFNHNYRYMNVDWFDIDLNKVLSDLNTLQNEVIQVQELKSGIKKHKESIASTFEESFFDTEEVDKLIKVLKYEYNSWFKRLFSSEYKEMFKKHKRLTHKLELSYEGLVDQLEKLSVMKQSHLSLEKLEKNIEHNHVKIKKSLVINDDLDIKELIQSLNDLKQLALFNQTHGNQPYFDTSYLKTLVQDKDYIDWKSLLEKSKSLVDTNDYLLGKIKYIEDEFDISKHQSYQGVSDFIDTLDFTSARAYFSYASIKEKLIDFGLKDFVGQIESQVIETKDILPIFKRRIYTEILNKKTHFSKELQHITTQQMRKHAREFSKYDQSTFDLATSRILTRLVSKIPNVNAIQHANKSEMNTLKTELNRKKGHKSTRRLIEELPTLLPLLKPCIMMSPLSVSTYFSSNFDWQFDMVIFDEASQIRPEYAIAAISRGKQIIVAGDSKQMPPTSFFNSESNDDLYDEDGEEKIVMESILDDLSTAIPQTYLNWHYRSKDESLISFSNNRFYLNKLATFPSNDASLHSHVEFIYVKDGVWVSKSGDANGNKIEADRVKALILDHIKTQPDKSLGVVAFGLAQANRIEEKIFSLKLDYPDFFNEHNTEPFFVKNLENVQGDERDVIILSVGYGPSPEGKISMNFGPLNKAGGQRRLNVAISRAKEKMIVVSSMIASDISTSEGSSNRQYLKDFLDYAQNGYKVLVASDDIVNEHVPEFDSDLEKDVYTFLSQQGYQVHTKIGNSGYRIDMAVIHPDFPDKYILAIECDGSNYHKSKSTRDRDRLRQEVLESKGWNFHRIYSTTWVNDNTNEKENLLERIRNEIESFGEEVFVEPVVEKDYLVYTDKSDEVKGLPDEYYEDVYVFRYYIDVLAEIVYNVIKENNYIGWNIEDVFRLINSEYFNKKRYTSGYKEIFNISKSFLVAHNKIELKDDVITNIY